jgi:hypothetical protein
VHKEHHLRFSFALKYTRGSWHWMGSLSIVTSTVGWKTRVRLPADHVCSLATTFTPTLRPTRRLCNAHLVRRPRREANHSRPSDVAITIMWMCTLRSAEVSSVSHHSLCSCIPYRERQTARWFCIPVLVFAYLFVSVTDAFLSYLFSLSQFLMYFPLTIICPLFLLYPFFSFLTSV